MEINIDLILAYIMAVAPALSAIIGCVVTFVKSKATSEKVINKFEEVRMEIFNTKEYTELKAQVKEVYNENLILKKKINELLTKIDHIDRGE